MPRRCCVPGCKSNYDSRLKHGEAAVSTFGFPKEEKEKRRWLRAIPRKDWQPSKSTAVCEHHFHEEDIVRFDISKNKEGDTISYPLKCPKLKKHAVPKVFQNLPSYLSTSESKPRTDPQQRRDNIFERKCAEIETFLDSDKILSFNNFSTEFVEKIQNISSWSFKKKDDVVWFYLLDIDIGKDINGVNVVSSVSVNSNLVVRVFLSEVQVPEHDLLWILPLDSKLSRWSQLENILIRYTNDTSNNITSHDSIERAKQSLEYCLNLEECATFVHKTTIELVYDQLNLITLKRRRYSPETIIFSFLMFSQSPACYNCIHQYLILPSKRYLQYLASSFNISPENDKNTSHYLKYISQHLVPRERYVSLLVDEIYVNSSLSFKSQNIVGFADNSNEHLAKTVQSFMITSTFGNFREIVRLTPVKCITGSELKDMVLKTIKFVQQCGFTVLTVITDDNRINQKMFNALSVCESMKNPVNEDLMIFLTYDFVHVFKNIRNNWLNLKNDMKTFVFPDFENNEITFASFQHLRILYDEEKISLVRKAFKLNRKSLYPTNFERQNVLLVDNIFHETTTAALKCQPGCEGTVKFLQIIKRWWDIVNIKNTLGAKLKRKDELCGSIVDVNDNKLIFLKQFIIWLEKWHSLEGDLVGKLSNDTFQAIYQCNLVLIKLSVYSLTELSINYILPGKLQTDNLERRFGQYRGLSGCNYNVSFRQVLESEKKIRINKLFNHIKDNNLALTLDNINNISNESEHNYSNIDAVDCSEFYSVFSKLELEVREIDNPVQEYILGYAIHSLMKFSNCPMCLPILVESKGLKFNDEYNDHLQRGGLYKSTSYVKTVFFHICCIFQTILDNPDLENNFFKCSFKCDNQHVILVNLTEMSLEASDFFKEFADQCHCGEHIHNIIKKVISTFANILLDNFTKYYNDAYKEQIKEEKLRKRRQTMANKQNKERKLKTLQS